MQNKNECEQWAQAIALRLSDEWSGKEDFPEDAILLQNMLEKLFKENPKECYHLN